MEFLQKVIQLYAERKEWFLDLFAAHVGLALTAAVSAGIIGLLLGIFISEHKKAAGRLKTVLATYNEAEDLINIGAYKSGSNRNIDYAIYKIDAVNKFLTQQTDEKFSFEDELQSLMELFADYDDFESGKLKLGEQPARQRR